MEDRQKIIEKLVKIKALAERGIGCLLYTSPSPRDA